MEQIGLEAVMRTKEFQLGVDLFNKKLKEMELTTDKTALAMREDFKLGLASQLASTKAATEQTDKMSGSMDAAGVAASSLSLKAAAAAVAIGTILAQAVIKVTTALKDFIMAGLDSAARAQELDFVIQLLANRLGITAEEMRGYVQSVVDYGIRTDVAQQFVIELTRRQLDLAKSTELARVAQDAAIATASDSSETLNRLLRGITTLNTESIRSAGINMTAADAYKNYADELGKTADQLNVTERQQAFMNEVLLKGVEVAGFYEAAMEAPGKQLRSFSRDMYELSRITSTYFLPAFGSVVTTMRTIAKQWRTAIDEGGPLYEIMVKLGAVASLLAEVFGDMATRASQAIIDFISGSTDTITGFISKTFTWGYNVVMQFASGIVRAASSVLVSAMNYIGKILTFWLAPGSPPRIAQDLPDWGLSAMTQFLHGFEMADFGVLSGLQQPIKAAMDILVSTGKMAADEVSKIYADISLEIAKVLTSGEGKDSLFDKIRQSAGIFGDEIVKLTEYNLQYTAAMEAVTVAQKAMKDAQKAATDSNKDVIRLTEEYNKLLRSGASKEELDAKLAEINAAEDQRALAIENVKTAAEGVEAATEQVDVYKELLDLQKQIVDQILNISKQQIDSTATAAGSGELGGMGELPEPEGGGGGGLNLEDAFTKAVEDAKEALRKQLADMWTKIKEDFNAMIAPYLADVKEAWDKLLPILQPVWDRIVEFSLRTWENVKLAWIEFKLWVVAEWEEWSAWAKDLWDKYGDDVVIVWNFIKLKISQIAVAIWNYISTWIGMIKQYWEENWGRIKEIATNIWEDIKAVIRMNIENIFAIIGLVSALIRGDWEGFLAILKERADATWELIKSLWNNALDNIRLVFEIWKSAMEIVWNTLFAKLVSIVKEKIEDFKEKISTGVDKVTTKFEDWKESISKLVTEIFENLVKIAKEKIDNFKQAGKDIVDGIIEGVSSRATDLYAKMLELAAKAWAAVSDFFLFGSPSKLTMQGGEWIVEGQEEGIENKADSLTKTMLSTMKNMYDETSKLMNSRNMQYSTSAASSNYSQSVEISFGDVYIKNDMDMYEFETRVKNVVDKVIRR